MQDQEIVEKAVDGCQYVFHEAAIVNVANSLADPVQTSRVNFGGTLHVLDAARTRGVRRVVFAGSAAVYGDEPTLPKVESLAASPITPYGVDKLASELAGLVYARTWGLEFVGLRYFNVFGTRQNAQSPYAGVISVFCDRMSRGSAPVIYGNGSQTRDFIHVDDVVRANLIAMEAREAVGRVFNVGTGNETTLLALVEAINRFLGRNFRPIHKPARAGDIERSVADNTALRSIGWVPTRSLADGLDDLLRS